jgi:hypothetical protein
VGVGGAGEERQGPAAIGASIVACRGGRQPRQGLWWGVMSRRSAQREGELPARHTSLVIGVMIWIKKKGTSCLSLTVSPHPHLPGVSSKAQHSTGQPKQRCQRWRPFGRRPRLPGGGDSPPWSRPRCAGSRRAAGLAGGASGGSCRSWSAQ